MSEINNADQEIERDFKPWGDVTNPRKHNPEKFRYLIHTINPMAIVSVAMLGISIKKDEPAGAINKEDGDQTINLYSNPERLDQRVALSCSLVDNEHHGTWGGAGLIVEAPSENVIITHPQDIGATVMSKKLLKEQARQKPTAHCRAIVAAYLP